MTDIRKIEVGLGDRSYEVLTGAGLLAQAAALIKPHLKRMRVVVVTDENVAPLYLSPLTENLQSAGVTLDPVTLPAGEQTKSFAWLEKLCDDLIRLQVERGDIIIALGGGVIGDLTGFASAILRRGCRFIQVPTTLLAQVDSSVGGKTAINAAGGKNLIGAFHQPSLVLADIDVLETLPARELRAGFAEVLKYGLIDNPGFFDWLESHATDLLGGDTALRHEAVAQSVAAKAKIVAADERETGVRALLNLGHTFGHAFEAQTGYSDQLLHGESVGLGMALAFEYSCQSGLCPQPDCERAIAAIQAAGLPVSPNEIPGFTATSAQLMSHIWQDKKVSDGKLTFILTRGIGQAFVAADVAAADIETFLQSKL